jgi:hypothetical protein
MDEKIIEEVRKKRNDLAYQIETLIRDFTNKTNYIVDKVAVEYKNTNTGLVPKSPSVRISIRVGLNNRSGTAE